MPSTPHTDENAIRERAYYLWEQDGRPEGRETEYWHRAMVAVTDRSQMETLTEPAPKPKAAAAKSKDAPAATETVRKSKKK